MESVSNDIAEPKKLKIAAEEPNMDPFKHLYDIHYLIYQHLTGSEILNMSEVSEAWYINTGKTNDCMSKIKFNFFLKKGTKYENPTELIETKRQHKNVAILWENAGMKLLNRAKVIETFAGSVVYLEIRAITNLVWEPVHLSKLKTLAFELQKHVIPSCCPSFMNVISQSNVENLIVNGRLILFQDTFKIIKKLMSSLRVLSLDHGYPKFVFENRYVAILHNLKLAKLKIVIEDRNYEPNYHSIVSLFLKSQAVTLEHLIICNATEKMLKISFEFSKLQILETNSSCLSAVTEWSAIPTSSSIVDVKISGYCRWPQNILQNLLERIPNLKQMTIDNLDTGSLQIIAQTAIKLENLYFKNGPSDIGEKYEAIQQNHSIIANRRIQLKPAVGQLLRFSL